MPQTAPADSNNQPDLSLRMPKITGTPGGPISSNLVPEEEKVQQFNSPSIDDKQIENRQNKADNMSTDYKVLYAGDTSQKLRQTDKINRADGALFPES